jgi:hypothetical protein
MKTRVAFLDLIKAKQVGEAHNDWTGYQNVWNSLILCWDGHRQELSQRTLQRPIMLDMHYKGALIMQIEVTP